jgi:hypothetical protein
MSRVLVYFARFALIFVAYVCASLAASAFMHGVALVSNGFALEEGPIVGPHSMVFSIPFVALFVSYFAFLPALVAILLSETFGWRDWLAYALAGAGIALIDMAFFFNTSDSGNRAVHDPWFWAVMIGGGIVGGMAYWLVAGRFAGNWHGRRRPAG